nr:hypothetical protein [Nanoarchaeota archaeon]
MVAQKSIETGVDKLVTLINRKKKISTNEAANELGVSIPVVQEWADFLEDQGLITVEYKLSRTYLCERKLTKKEIEKKAKVYASKKDAFTRKVETALKSLQKESEGFEKIKTEFKKLRDTIGSDIDQVRVELQELRHYEDLKKNIDKDIIQQRLDYQEMLNNIHRQITEQKKKYESFIDEVEVEKAKIEEARVEMSYLENREDNLKKRLDSLKEIMKSIENKIAEQKRIIRSSLDKINSDLKEEDKLEKDIRFRIKEKLEPVIRTAKEKEEKVLAVQDSILKKIMDKKKEIDKYKLESTQAAEEFKAFFERKAKTQELITALEKQKAELEEELQGLVMKAQSFKLSVKSSDVKDYVKELQKSFKEIEKKKSSFIKRLGELTDTITKK